MCKYNKKKSDSHHKTTVTIFLMEYHLVLKLSAEEFAIKTSDM